MSRIKVCLNKIFHDHRPEAFVNVNSSLLYVHNLEEHIRRIFAIKQNIYLTIDGVLLPPHENIQVVHSGDVISVNAISGELTAIRSVDGNNRNIEFNVCSKNSSQIKAIVAKDDIDSNKRGKRIRKRKKKTKNGTELQIEDDLRKAKLIATNTFAEKELDLSETNSNSHIRFCENDTVAQGTSSESDLNNSKDVLQASARVCSNSTVMLTSSARVIRPVCVLTDSESTHHVKSVTSECPVSIDQWKQKLIKLKDFASDVNFKNVSENIDFEVIRGSIDKNKDFVTLEDKLQKFDIIGFQILKINNSYMPELSNWIIGMVIELDEQNITLHVLEEMTIRSHGYNET